MGKKISLIDVLIILLFLLALYFILTRILGHSATDLAITVTLFSLLATALYKLNREIGEFKIRSINTFDRLKDDLELIKNKLDV